MSSNLSKKSAFNELMLGDVVTFQRGFDITKKEQMVGSVPIVSSSGVSSVHNQWRVKGPGVVIGRKGSLGTVHYIKGNFWPHDTTLWVKDFKGNHPRFLSYFLKTMHLESFDAGSSNPTLNRNHIHKIKTVLPTFDLQQKSAAILSAYDDLLETNTKRVSLLERMANEIYREWFVRMRFPGYKETTFCKGIPTNWDIQPLGALSDLRKDKYLDDMHGELPLLDLARMLQKTLMVGSMGHANDLSTSRIIFNEDDILFGSIRPYLHKVALAPCSGVSNISVFVIRPKTDNLNAFLTALLFSKASINWAEQYSTGTKMPVIKWEVFKKMPVLLPGQRNLDLFQEKVQPMYECIKKISAKSKLLRQSRDQLLTRVLSGKLSVESLDIQFPPSMQEDVEIPDKEPAYA